MLVLAAPMLSAVELPLREGQPEPDEMPWQGPEGVRERVEQIMERQKGAAGIRPRMELHPHNRSDPGLIRPNPDSPDTAIFPIPAAGEPGTVQPNTPQVADVSFLGATLADTHAFPPDTMGAAGPAQYIVAVNGRIRSFNKSSGLADGVMNADTDVFFGSVMTPPATNNFTSDPRIRYDRLSQRWFILIIDVPGRQGKLPNRILLAVSDGPVVTPSSAWSFFQFQHDQVSPTGDTGKFADYPTLGIDANALYIGINVFNTSGPGGFYNTTAFVVRKASVLGAGPVVVTAFRKLQAGSGSGLYTPQGVDNYDPAATEGYFIGVDGQAYGRLNLRRVSDPGGTPTLSGNVQFTVPATGGTLSVPHLGNTGGANGNLDGLDYRLLAAHIRNGRLWTSANMAVDNTGSPSGTDTRMAVRWYELDGIATGQTPTVIQSGTLFDPSANTRSYWMGTVMVSGQGHAAMGFSSAGPNDRINAGTVGRLKHDTLGTMRTPLLYTASSTAYNPASDPGSSAGRRWGDYSYTCVDPDDDMTMWTIQEFCSSTDSYGVQILRLLAPAPAVPSGCSPPSVFAGTTTNVTLIGLSDGDTGFFDPGSGFSNRLAAVVGGGGVTVNSLTYNNPTNLTLNLSISAGAATGARTLTVTNPDGQLAASASGILNILSVGSTNVGPALAFIANQTNLELLTLVFTNTATDANGDALTFSLDPGAPGNAAIDPATGVFTWTPSESQGPGTSNITVRVTDNGSPPLSDAQTFSVTVLESNLPPALEVITDRTLFELTTLTFTNSATDPDIPANTLTFSFAATPPANATLNSSSGVFTWIPSEAQGPGTNVVSIRVADNGSPSLSATQTFTLFVLEANSPPALAPIADRVVFEQQTLTLTNIAGDTDIPANTLTFSLENAPAGAVINSGTGVCLWTPDESQGATTNTLSVVVTDNGSPSLSATQTFTVIVLETNAPPTLAAIPSQTITVGMLLVFTNTASDTDNPAQTLTFSLGAGAATNATLNPATGVFYWAPLQSQIGTNPFSVIVTDDGLPTLSATQTFSVIVVASNTPPTLAAIPDRSITVGMNLVFTNTASDVDSPPQILTFSLGAGAATNATLDAAIGVFNWAPVQSQIGTNPFSIIVTDDGLPALSATQTFSVVVVASNTPPTLAAIPDLTIHAGTTLLWTNSATDPDVPAQTLTFSLDAAPPAASIGASDGILTWTPADSQGGSNYFAVRVTDDGVPNLSDTQSFSVNVMPRPFVQIGVTNGVAELTWSAITGVNYRVLFIPSLSESNWFSLPGDILATGSTASATDTNLDFTRLYRIFVIP